MGLLRHFSTDTGFLAIVGGMKSYRLWRGEGSHGSAPVSEDHAGQWFTPDRTTAEDYAYKNSGHLRHLDVTEEDKPHITKPGIVWSSIVGGGATTIHVDRELAARSEHHPEGCPSCDPENDETHRHHREWLKSQEPASGQKQGVLGHFESAARPGRGQETCSCCNGKGEHADGSSCDRCNTSGYTRRGDREPNCPGQAQPKRRHWRESGKNGDLPELEYKAATPDRDDPHFHELSAVHPDKGQVAFITWHDEQHPDRPRAVHAVWTDKSWQRRGIATELFRRASQVTPGLQHSDDLNKYSKPWVKSLASVTATAEPQLEVTDYEGTTGSTDHITRTERGMMPTSSIAHLPGARGERPGEHANRQGADWELFKRSISQDGITDPLFITVDHGQGPKISEGNHRRDAAVELGHSHVPVEVRYFGRAEQQGTVHERAQLMHREATVAASHPSAERVESVSHILHHYQPTDFDTWEEVRENIDWTHPKWRAFTEDVRANGVRRPIPVDYEQDPPRVMNGHTRLLAAERAGVEHVPTRQHEGFMDPDDPDHLGRGPDDPEHWTNQEYWQHEAAVGEDMIDLYHHTTPERRAEILASGRMHSPETVSGEPAAFFTTDPDPVSSQGTGRGGAVVHLRIPEHLATLEDEFPSGEQHYSVPVRHLRLEHFADPKPGRREAVSTPVVAHFEHPKAPGHLGEQGYQVHDESRGFYAERQNWSGYQPQQTWGVLRLHHSDGTDVAHLDYSQVGKDSDPHHEVHVEDLQAGEGHGGKGYASALMDHLYATHPEPAQVTHSLRTDEGGGWWDRYVSSRPHIAERERRQHETEDEDEGHEVVAHFEVAAAGLPGEEFEPADEDHPRHRLTLHQPGGTHWLHWHPETGEVTHLHVEDRGKGIATAMWRRAHEIAAGHDLPAPAHSAYRSPAGDAWARSVGGHLPPLNNAAKSEKWEEPGQQARPRTAVLEHFGQGGWSRHDLPQPAQHAAVVEHFAEAAAHVVVPKPHPEAECPDCGSPQWRAAAPTSHDEGKPWGVCENGNCGAMFDASRAGHKVRFERDMSTLEGERHGRPAHGPYYHGSVDEDVEEVTPQGHNRAFEHDHEGTHAYATGNLDSAWEYAQRKAEESGRHPRVYEVEPHEDDIEMDPKRDPGNKSRRVNAGDVRSRAGFRVVREMPLHHSLNYLYGEESEDGWGDEEDGHGGHEAAVLGHFAEAGPAVPSFVHRYETYEPDGAYAQKERTVEGPFYHGGRARLAPGGLLTPGRKTNSWGDEGPKSTHIHFSTEMDASADYARKTRGHLYEVEPTGEVVQGYQGTEFKSRHPLRVVRKVPREEWDGERTAVVKHFAEPALTIDEKAADVALPAAVAPWCPEKPQETRELAEGMPGVLRSVADGLSALGRRVEETPASDEMLDVIYRMAATCRGAAAEAEDTIARARASAPEGAWELSQVAAPKA